MGVSPAIKRFLKYSAVGVSTFIFDLILLYVLVDVYGLPQVSAAGLAFLMAVSINYWLSRRFVFKGTLRGVKAGYSNFILIAVAGLLIVMSGMYMLTEQFGLPYLLARIITAAVTGSWNYLINLFVNFKVAGKH